MATTIDVDRAAPVAAPVGQSVNLTTSYQDVAEPNNFLVPERNNTTTGVDAIQPGFIEFTSPVILANKSGTERTVTLRITRADATVSVLMDEVPVQPNDTVLYPINGQVLLNNSGTTDGTGDKLEALASADDAIDLTVSYTLGQAESTNGS